MVEESVPVVKTEGKDNVIPSSSFTQRRQTQLIMMTAYSNDVTYFPLTVTSDIQPPNGWEAPTTPYSNDVTYFPLMVTSDIQPPNGCEAPTTAYSNDATYFPLTVTSDIQPPNGCEAPTTAYSNDATYFPLTVTSDIQPPNGWEAPTRFGSTVKSVPPRYIGLSVTTLMALPFLFRISWSSMFIINLQHTNRCYCHIYRMCTKYVSCRISDSRVQRTKTNRQRDSIWSNLGAENCTSWCPKKMHFLVGLVDLISIIWLQMS